jgi:FkbH-like protein
MTISELAASLTPSPASYLKAARILAAGTIVGLRPLRVNVLSTFTAQFLGPYLQVEGALRGFLIDPWFAPWGQLEEQALDEHTELYTSQPHAIVVLARFEELDSMMPDRSLAMGDPEKLERLAAIEARFEGLVAGLRKRTKCPLFIANCPPPVRPVEGLAAPSLLLSQSAVIEMFNHALAAISRIQPDVYVFDLSRAASDHGLRNWHDPKLYFLARVPFGASAQIAIAKALVRTLRAALVPPAKVLVLDLDGTLWGGVLGEDGIGGIALGDEYPGNVFKAFQRYLRTLRQRGVLLAIASKNNEADVEEVFARHTDLGLRLEDFAAIRVNWRDKSENLRALASELNLGLDALVLFDDSPFEREEVRHALPEVTVLDVPESPLGFIGAIEDSGIFDRLAFSAEDSQRTEQYRTRAVRTAAEQSISSSAEFLQSLGLVATIGAVDAATLPRVVQLLGKTNQFNLTMRRHGAAEIKAMMGSDAIVLWLRLADRFGDHGLVGAAIAYSEAGAARIDTFLLSCRVIGRGAETALLAELARRASARAQVLIGEYMPAAKNAQVAEFYPRHGFVPAGEGRWQLPLPAASLAVPDYIELRQA